MDVHSPNPEPHDEVAGAPSLEQLLQELETLTEVPDLDVSCSWCKVESGGQYDPKSQQILCGSCTSQWPLIFGASNDSPK